MRDLKAKGTRQCSITNFSGIAVESESGTPWRIVVTKDIYPGTRVFFLVAGKRYSGTEPGIRLTAEMLAALRAEASIEANYTDWPYRSDQGITTTLAGFATDYDRCVRYLAREAGPEIFTPD